jgi:hypothetical protein
MLRCFGLVLALVVSLACGPDNKSSDAGTGASTTETASTGMATGTSGTTTTAPTTSASDDTGAAPLCEGTSASDLPGVAITFPPQRCSFTLAEAAAGLTFTYEVTIDAPVAELTSQHNDAGSCDQPGPSGLITAGQVAGNGEMYCLCDQGLCAGDTPTVELAAGVFPDSFSWDGVNWSGPSDTNNPKGAPFPAGNYAVSITSHGLVGTKPFKLQASLPLTLVP